MGEVNSKRRRWSCSAGKALQKAGDKIQETDKEASRRISTCGGAKASS
jgi:hypothetical protein